MKRTNIFKLKPAKEQEQRLFELADNCARMFNEINYKRRQSFFSRNFEWNTDESYHKYKKIIGSATAQQVTRKNNEAWKSFFALLRLKKQGKLPRQIRKVSPPGYWKDRKTGKRVLTILIRCDCYKLSENCLKLPFGLKVRWKGKNRWKGKKQGRLEIRYGDLSSRWYTYMPVEVENPLHQPVGNKRAYVDLGVVNLITAWIEGDKKATIYSGRTLLSDWWYWKHKIAQHQSLLKSVNKKNHTSKRLRKLYTKRKRRLKNDLNALVHRFLKDCWSKGVKEIFCGDLTNITNGKGNRGKKGNAMVNNFWSHKYLIDRMRTTAENFGISLKQRSEAYTSVTCSLCGKRYKNGRKHRGLYVCRTYSKAVNADVNAVANLANSIFPNPSPGRDNWLVAQPSVVKIKTTTVEPPTL